MTDKRAYTPPTVSSEILTIGVFGNYGNCGGRKKKKKPKVDWWLWR